MSQPDLVLAARRAALVDLLREIAAEEREVLFEHLAGVLESGREVDRRLLDFARAVYADAFANGHEKGWDDHSSQTPMDF